MKWIYAIAISIFLFSCQSSSGDTNAKGKEDTVDSNYKNGTSASDEIAIDEELASLTTDSRRITFQRMIIKSDLDMRKAQTTTLQNHGYDSPEYKKATEVVAKTDRDNMTKTLGFLENFGVSDNQSVGRMQAHAMALVMSHSSDIGIYQSMIQSFDRAWKMDYMDATSYASFLQDYYRLKFGSRLEMKNPYRTADEITALLEALK